MPAARPELSTKPNASFILSFIIIYVFFLFFFCHPIPRICGCFFFNFFFFYLYFFFFFFFYWRPGVDCLGRSALRKSRPPPMSYRSRGRGIVGKDELQRSGAVAVRDSEETVNAHT
jgi:hypothetical protein